MKKALSTVALLTVTATSAFAFSQNAPQNEKAAVHRSGLHSFAMVPANGSSRVPQFDYHRSTSEYPFGPGYNLPYPDRPYGDPDHW